MTRCAESDYDVLRDARHRREQFVVGPGRARGTVLRLPLRMASIYSITDHEETFEKLHE